MFKLHTVRLSLASKCKFVSQISGVNFSSDQCKTTTVINYQTKPRMSLQQRYIDSISRWTCPEIREELTRLQLPTTGLKDDLVLRLQVHYRQTDPDLQPANAQQQQNSDDMAGNQLANDGMADSANQSTGGDDSDGSIRTTPDRPPSTGGDNFPESPTSQALSVSAQSSTLPTIITQAATSMQLIPAQPAQPALSPGSTMQTTPSTPTQSNVGNQSNYPQVSQIPGVSLPGLNVPVQPTLGGHQYQSGGIISQPSPPLLLQGLGGTVGQPPPPPGLLQGLGGLSSPTHPQPLVQGLGGTTLQTQPTPWLQPGSGGTTSLIPPLSMPPLPPLQPGGTITGVQPQSWFQPQTGGTTAQVMPPPWSQNQTGGTTAQVFPSWSQHQPSMFNTRTASTLWSHQPTGGTITQYPIPSYQDNTHISSSGQLPLISGHVPGSSTHQSIPGIANQHIGTTPNLYQSVHHNTPPSSNNHTVAFSSGVQSQQTTLYPQLNTSSGQTGITPAYPPTAASTHRLDGSSRALINQPQTGGTTLRPNQSQDNSNVGFTHQTGGTTLRPNQSQYNATIGFTHQPGRTNLMSSQAPPYGANPMQTSVLHQGNTTQVPSVIVPDLASTRVDHQYNAALTGGDRQPLLNSQDELNALEMELRILKARDEIRSYQHRLTRPPEELSQYSMLNPSTSEVNSSMLSLVKQSVDINSLPPAKPIKFSGEIIEYPKWRSTFDLLIENKALLPHQKLVYLQDYLSGEALDLVKGVCSLNSAEAYIEARRKLDEKYGDPFDITEAFRDRLESWPRLADNDSKGLQKYSNFLDQCVVTMSAVSELGKLSDPREMKGFPNTLPSALMNKWSRLAGSLRYDHKRHPTFHEYSAFVKKEAFLASSNTTSVEALSKACKNTTKKKSTSSSKSSTTLHTTVEPSSQPSTTNSGKPAQTAKKMCHMCKSQDSHNTIDCRKLSKLPHAKQQEFMKSEQLCSRCLRKGHSIDKCYVKVKCAHCKADHATCLHNSKKAPTESTESKDKAPATETTVHHISSEKGSGLTTMILPVYVSSLENPDNETLVYALVDNMSDTSFICTDTADYLKAASTPAKLRMSTMTTRNKMVRCKKYLQLRVRGMNSDNPIFIPQTYSMACIPGNRAHIPTPETARRWKHLKKLVNKVSPLQSCEISLLIGFNCPAASNPLSTMKGSLTKPYGIETILGWSIVGGISNGTNQLMVCNRIITEELPSEEILQCLQEDFSYEEGPPMSQNDLLFMKRMKESVTTVDGHYTMPLPFKQTPQLPNNRSYAMKRFQGLQRKLAANPVLNSKYREFMTDIISRGEAQPCNSDEDGWYIPHHGVFSPHNPDKLRVVFDCSASYQGYSLNKQLLQGPDLNNNLAGLLCRFRKDKIAVTCDIQKMFHQFRVTKDHRKFLKFLWYKDGTDEIIDHQMNVHLFGATSSPSCSIFGLKQLASDHSHDYPRASSFIHDNFYVDDGLISLSTPSEAIQLIKDAQALTKKGNLVLHKFLCNNAEVAQALGCDGPTTKDLSSNSAVNRALGLIWDISKDTFKFSDKSDKPKPITRRGLLSTVASVFDPLGFLSPFTLKGKLLIQELCKDEKEWDDPLTDDQTTKWKKWLDNLPDLESFKVPRCFFDKELNYQDYSVELHLFADASSYAYGTCAYIRMIESTLSHISVSLVMSKSRVGPQKAVTIPRLELQAATLSVKLSDFLIRELKYPELKVFYWSDSETVLGYIANEAKAFHTFVCNRVQRIKDSSTTSQWHYVSTDENPADMVSRGVDVSQLSEEWLHGPGFLSDLSFNMLDQPTRTFPLKDDDPEIKKVFTHAISTEAEQDLLSMFDKYNSWTQVTHVISYILRLGSRYRKNDVHPNSSRVFFTIARLLQQTYFSEEMEKLQSGMPLTKQHSMFKLDPFINSEDGLLRVGGRLEDSLSSYDRKHPVILPGSAHLTKLYASLKHAETAHQGKLTTMNHIRASGVYLFGQGARMVSSVIHNCLKCIRLRGRPITQKMSSLPTVRTEPTPPFTHVGMDVFGPFSCKDGRKESKRYGLIFTCLASRGVHLELLEDMSTDCFINSFRCFTSIRGPVQTLLSDQGTNFVGARNEFHQSLLNMMDGKAQRYLKSKQCQFKFNVPSASHMGGSWERLIRTVRNVMKGILLEQTSSRLDTASLRTLLYECMAIVNSRPLTVDQLNQDSTIEPLPLSPNMLLTMKTDVHSSPPGDFEEPDLYSRKRWRRVQYLAQQFWSRWKKEYLHQLQSRQKWNSEQRNLQIGDIVLLGESDQPRCDWKLALVTETYASRDDLVRKVRLHIGNGHYLDRPVHKLVLLLPTSTSH